MIRQNIIVYEDKAPKPEAGKEAEGEKAKKPAKRPAKKRTEGGERA